MANYGRCDKCGSYGWLPHACKEFECAIEYPGDGEPDWHALSAFDPEAAAEKFADQYDCEGDYTIVRAGDRGNTIVLVRYLGMGEVKRFAVYGESVPQYHAREIQALEAEREEEEV